ncbi:OLC1v1001204C2 [Oldenlandia corymbosa var. corymbosa]|nr:OLC1v1001204C2 [Oldenlandia corymbosa var. corymbosa]
MEDKSWVIKVNEDVSKLSEITGAEKRNWELHSIYKLPACVTDLNKNAYKPRAISFGPYHYGDPKLYPMEAHKHRALLHFLKKSRKPLDFYVCELNSVVRYLKDAYDSLDDKWEHDSEAFVQLMIRDGCFMLEVLRACSPNDSDGQATRAEDEGYAENDPIFSNHGKLYMMPYIKRDMLMLENQLPMLLLNKLLSPDEQAMNDEDEYINRLILQFSFPSTPHKRLGRCKHVLDAYRKSLLWEDPDIPKFETRPYIGFSVGGDDIVPSAAQLHEAGIVIQRNTTGSLTDISFSHGILRLPQIVVDDTSEPVFLNLIAFERFHVDAGNEVTSYISFMDDIIDNAKDVSLLHSREIIHNAIGSDKAVAQLFNSLSKDITLDPESHLIVVRKRANQYSKRHWNQWRANLIHNYFTSPWAILSVIAAIFLFGLTIVQTVYTIGQYYQS